MGMLLAFAPFVAFAVLQRAAGVTAGLAAGLAVAGVLVAREAVAGRSAKLLEVGTVVLFAGLLGWRVPGGWSPGVAEVRLWVDGGLLAIALGSLLAGRPFTLAYARERVGREAWGSPAFLRANRVITGAWAAAFAVMTGADAVMMLAPKGWLPAAVGATVAAFVAAAWFTGWYPARLRKGVAA